MNKNDFIPEKITIFFTTKCNIHCKHCFINPLVKDNKIMENQLFKDIIYVANKWGVKNVKITGGEPILFWKVLKQYIEDVKNNNIEYCICTNAFWAESDNSTETIIKEMYNVGVRRIEISTDLYHQEFISLQNVIRCIEYAQKYNIRTIVTICGEAEKDELVTICKIAKVINNKKDIHFQYVGCFGAASKNNLTSHISTEVLKKLRCTQVRQPVITYNGDIFACCGPSLIIDKHSKLYLGKFSVGNNLSLLNRLRNDEFLCELYERGPLFIVNKNNINLNQQHFSSLCEVCIKI